MDSVFTADSTCPLWTWARTEQLMAVISTL